MSSIISKSSLDTNFVTRPKVHRLPPVNNYRIANSGRKKTLVIVAATLLLTVASISIGIPLLSASASNSLNPVTLPAIVVSSHNSSLDGASFIADAQASAGTAAQATAAHANAHDAIISLHNDSEHIVGQMTKLSGGSEQITEIKSANNIDKAAGQQLLSIISKY